VGPSTTDAWDRLGHVWHRLFAVALAVPTAIALADADLTASDRRWVLALAAGYALWHWIVLVRHPERHERLVPMAAYWLGATGFVGLLAGLHGAFALLLYGIYPLLFATMGWWGMGPYVALTALVGWRAGAFGSGVEAVVNLVASAGLAAVIAFFVDQIATQSSERKAALQHLADTRAELATTARHAGVLEERERLARELHDTVAQSLTSVVAHLEALDQALEGQPAVPAVHHHLDQARAVARDGLGEVRRSVRALRPDLLEGATLADALGRTCRSWSATTGVVARLQVTGDPGPLPPEVEAALLRTAQEALSNAGRHAAATRVVVTLSYLDDAVALDVRDDGVGVDPARLGLREDGGFGMTTMRERVEALGGQLVVESGPGEGTSVAARVPA
jgi:signal transduction histidine kinase